MPGVNLNLPIPSLADTQTQVVTKTAQALTLINTDLAAKVVSSEIDINANLGLNGFALTNVGSLQFSNSTVSALPGNIFYSNGEWFLVDSTGSVQITSNGAINLAVVGAIGGDYSTVNALLSYDSANTRYRFFGSGGTALVDTDARNYVANGAAAGKVTFGVDSSLATNITFNVKSVPTSNIGILGYDASVGAVVNGSTITAPTTFSNTTTFGSTIVASGLIQHPAYTTEIPLFVGEETQTNVQTGATGLTGIVSGNVSVWSSSPFGICGLRTNDIVQSVTVRFSKITTDVATVTIKKRTVGGVTSTVASTGGSTTSSGSVDVTATISAPTAMLTRERWWVELGFKQATITAATVSWTQ